MTLRVLVVDDDALVRALFGQILRPPAFQVIGEAADGAQAVALYRQLRPDVVLLDLAMPGVDGFTAQRQIMAFDPAAAIVVCSAISSERTGIEVLARGARAFVRRPFRVAELRTVLTRAAGRPPQAEPVPVRVVPDVVYA